METCLLRKKKICSFDILEENGKKNMELEIIWRIASQKKLLYCDECGEAVFLKSGNIKVPHFAHNLSYDNKFCSKRNFITSEEYINNKKNIYTILKKIPEISFLEVDFENKVEFLTTYNNMNIKIYLKKIEEFLESKIKYEGIVFLYGNEKNIKSIKKDKNLFYLNNREIIVLEPLISPRKINLDMNALKELYLKYIALEKDKRRSNIDLFLKENINNFYKKFQFSKFDNLEKEIKDLITHSTVKNMKLQSSSQEDKRLDDYYLLSGGSLINILVGTYFYERGIKEDYRVSNKISNFLTVKLFDCLKLEDILVIEKNVDMSDSVKQIFSNKIIGFLFYKKGFVYLKRLIFKYIGLEENFMKNYEEIFNQIISKTGLSPQYTVVSESGLDHCKIFEIKMKVQNKDYYAKAKSKKEAMKECKKMFLDKNPELLKFSNLEKTKTFQKNRKNIEYALNQEKQYEKLRSNFKCDMSKLKSHFIHKSMYLDYNALDISGSVTIGAELKRLVILNIIFENRMKIEDDILKILEYCILNDRTTEILRDNNFESLIIKKKVHENLDGQLENKDVFQSLLFLNFQCDPSCNYLKTLMEPFYKNDILNINKLEITQAQEIFQKNYIDFEYSYIDSNIDFSLEKITCNLKVNLLEDVEEDFFYSGVGKNKKEAKRKADEKFLKTWSENLDFLFSTFRVQDYNNENIVEQVNNKKFLNLYINHFLNISKDNLIQILDFYKYLKKYNLKEFSEIKKFVEKIAGTFRKNEEILDKLLKIVFIGVENLNEENYEKCLNNRWNNNLESILLGIYIQNSKDLFLTNNLENIYRLVETLSGEEEFELSKNILESLLIADIPLNESLKLKSYENLALIYEVENVPEKALENYNKILEINSKDIYVLWKIAYLNEALNNLEKALEIYDKLELLDEDVFKEKREVYLKLDKRNKEFLENESLKEEVLNKHFVINRVIGDLYFLKNTDLKLEFQILSKSIPGKVKPLTNGDILECKIIKNQKNEFDFLEANFFKNTITGTIKYIDLENRIVYVQDLLDKIYYQYCFEKHEKEFIGARLEKEVTINLK